MAKTTAPKKAPSKRVPLEPALATGNAESYYQGDPDYSPGFTPGGGLGAGGMLIQDYYKMVTQAEKLFTRSGVYRRLIEIMRDNIHGYGITVGVSSKDKRLQPYEAACEDVLKEGFFGDVNRIDLKYPKWICEQLITGEMCIPKFDNPITGFVELGYIPARWITRVTLNARNVLDAISIDVQAGDWIPNKKKEGGEMKRTGNPETMKVVRYDRSQALRDEKNAFVMADGKYVVNPDYLRLSGDCFYWRSGNLSGQERGQGDGFALADLVITLEQGIRDFLARYDAQAALVYDLLIKGATMKDIKNKWSRLRLPTGRVPFAHNERVVLTLHSPSMRIEDLTNFIRTLMVLISGSAGVPEFNMGDGSQTNVATAREQSPAMYAKFILRRKEFEAQLQMMARYMLERANEKMQLYKTDPTTLQQGVSEKLSQEDLRKMEIAIDFKPFERSNLGDVVSAFKTLIDAAVAAVDNTLMSKKAAGKMVRSQLSQLGVTLDEVAEEEQIKKEKTEKDELSQAGVSETGEIVRHDDVTKTAEAVKKMLAKKKKKQTA